MNVYLDIDGVLLANEENLAIGAVEFIIYAVEHFDVYWLTTHCMDGTTDHAIEYLDRAANEDLRPWLEKLKPVTWSIKKTEAIDFTKPFLWFDDDCFTIGNKSFNIIKLFIVNIQRLFFYWKMTPSLDDLVE